MACLIKNLNATTSILSFHLRNTFKKNVMDYNHVRCIKMMSLHNIALPASTRKYKSWDQSELDMFKDAVSKHGKKWKYISKECFESKRNNISLSQKWKHLELMKSRPYHNNIWTEGEDKILMDGIKKYGVGSWTKIAKLFPNKIPGQVRSRWNALSNKKCENWTNEDDDKLFDLVNQYGRKWAKISKLMDKPYNYCRNRYICLTYKPWTSEEKEKFCKVIKEFDSNWDKINEEFPDRTISCLKIYYRRNAKLHSGVNTGRWSNEEIERFTKAYEKFGNQWSLVSNYVGTRTSIQCHNRKLKKL